MSPLLTQFYKSIICHIPKPLHIILYAYALYLNLYNIYTQDFCSIFWWNIEEENQTKYKVTIGNATEMQCQGFVAFSSKNYTHGFIKVKS